jgi:hypothetical protein
VTDTPSVPTERVVQILCREPLGEALWRAAANEAIANALAEQLEALQQKKEG